MAIAIQNEGKYTLADRPPEISEKLWKAMVEQGTVESSHGDNLPEVTEQFWADDAEFEAFLEFIKKSRADRG